MKTLPILFLILASSFASSQTTKFTTTFKFIGIVEGYDHNSKMQIWVDGALLGESIEVKESAGG